MNNLCHWVIAFTLLCTSNLAFANEKTVSDAVQKFPEVTIGGTQERLLKSKIVGQEYKVWVSLPQGYHQSKKNYPVIYLLDAQWDFTMLISIYGQLNADGYVPDSILVGITWGGDNPNAEILRARDFTPTRMVDWENSGGATKFLSFIEKELIPFIDDEYRAESKRILIGSSLGGLFTLYAMFKEPGLFSGYLATATSTWWDNEVIFSYAQNYLKHSHKHPVKLYSAAGEFDGVINGFKKMQAFFDDKQPKGLNYQIKIFDNLAHSGIKANGNTRGLQFLFARDKYNVAPAYLSKLLGRYTNTEGAVLTVSAGKSVDLEVINPSGELEPFNAINDNEFYRVGADVKLKFYRSKTPTKVEALTPDGVFTFERTE